MPSIHAKIALTPFRFQSYFLYRNFDIQKLHLLLLSKIEGQAENGTKNYQFTHSQTFANLLVILP